MEQQVNKVISYSQGIENPQTDELLSQWRKAKQSFIDFWLDGELTKEFGHVQFTLSQKGKKDRFNNFYDWVYQLGVDTNELVEFLRHIHADDFFANSLSTTYPISITKAIPKGSKIIKSFKYFVNDKALLEQLQNKASEIIQENKVSGTLVLSVHPLDFLSSSENNFNWRSCHSLDGEFRAGNLSYMVDNHTIMCYLKSDEDVRLPHFPEDVLWNNKKWRCLLFVDNAEEPEICFSGRQYPFFAEEALTRIQKLLPSNCYTAWTEWNDKAIAEVDDGTRIIQNQYYLINRHIYYKKDLIQDAPCSMHFNDLLYSSCYDPYYTYRLCGYASERIKYPTITLGGAVRCLRCGEKVITTKDTMMCLDCELEYGNSESDDYCRCDRCDIKYLTEDGYWIDNDRVCPNCYENYSFTCQCCGERCFIEDQRYSQNYGGFICNYCYMKEED